MLPEPGLYEYIFKVIQHVFTHLDVLFSGNILKGATVEYMYSPHYYTATRLEFKSCLQTFRVAVQVWAVL